MMVAKELEELEGTSSNPQLSLSQTAKQLLGRGGERRPFIILLVLFIVYPLCGMYSIAFFAIDLFQKLGLGNVQTVAVSSALVRVLGTALSSGLMARFGRRKLYIPACVASSILILQDGGYLPKIDYVDLAQTNLHFNGNSSRTLPAFVSIAIMNGGGSERSLEYDTMSDRYA